MIFHAKGTPIQSLDLLILFGTVIQFVESFTSLGIVFTPTLSWDAHISKTCITLSRFVGILWRNRPILPLKTKLTLYYAFFYSYLSYCFLVWGNTTITNMQKPQILPKKILRAISNVEYDAPAATLYTQHKIIPVNKMFDYKFANFVKKTIQRNDQFLNKITALVPYKTPYATRTTTTFRLPQCRTNCAFAMLKYILSKLLNSTLQEKLPGMSFAAPRKNF
ncbi:uncharacterized protein LOC144162753 [Haemaphysalis longicornis]